ncbi:MAG: hypothetical protein RLN67_02105 [Algiphilus sp.]|uniref:hypothetical protein n=1 Tax=Algiphilus sp. TaxID=1872431 RepID=UPI0032EB9DF5
MNQLQQSTPYTGTDSYGRPKSEYIEKLSLMDSESLSDECYSMIYQSARCGNNPRADWHWMVDACYDESERRGGGIYDKAWKQCYRDHAE